MIPAPSKPTAHDPESAAARVEWLRHEIEQYNYRYYVLDAPTITDAEYDALMCELSELEREYPELQSSDSPTQRVGGEVAAGFKPHRHLVPMLSLGNAFNDEELASWYRRVISLLGYQPPLVAEPKIDGLAISLTYVDGRLTVGATRGNGIEGEDVTANLRTLRDVPLRLLDDPPELVEVRGEVYMPIRGFQALNERRAAEGQSLFANPRNAAAGSVRQLDPAVTRERPLRLFAYALGAIEGEKPRTQTELLEQLRRWGFPVNPLIRCCASLELAQAYCDEMLVRRESLAYEIDGVVLKVDDIAAQEQLGFVGREPRWAIAFKFAPRQATTRLLDIRVNVGRTGALNPYAVLEPVRVGGVLVHQATLHNEQDIHRKDIRIGDMVIVHRAGDVIPQVVKPVVEARTGQEQVYHLPDRCPMCGTPIVRNEDEAMARCPNVSCPARRYELIKHFVSQSSMDIRGLGDRLVAALLESGLIRDFADLYDLTAEKLMTLPNIKEKSASNLLAAIERSKSRPFKNVLFALGIRYVGEQTAELLATAFGDIDRLSSASIAELEAVEGIGHKTAESVAKWFANPVNQHLVERLRAAGVTMSESAHQQTDGPLAGKTFLLTGKLEQYTRGEAERRLRELGARIAPGISRSVDYLIVGTDPGSKLSKAQQLGTQLRDEAWLQQVLEMGRILEL